MKTAISRRIRSDWSIGLLVYVSSEPRRFSVGWLTETVGWEVRKQLYLSRKLISIVYEMTIAVRHLWYELVRNRQKKLSFFFLTVIRSVSLATRFSRLDFSPVFTWHIHNFTDVTPFSREESFKHTISRARINLEEKFEHQLTGLLPCILKNSPIAWQEWLSQLH